MGWKFLVSPQIHLLLRTSTGKAGQILWMTLFFWGLLEQVVFFPVKISQLPYSIYILKFTSFFGQPGSEVPGTSVKVYTGGKDKAISRDLMFDI